MRKTYKDMSLRKKMPLLFCGLLFLIILIMGSILYFYYQNAFRHYFQKNFKMAITTNSNGVKEIFGRIENAIAVVNDNEDAYIRDDMKNISTMAKLIILTRPQEREFNLKAMVEEIQLNELAMDSMFYSSPVYGIIVPDEYPIAAYLKEWNGVKSGFFKDLGMEEIKWYEKTKKLEGETYWFMEESIPRRLYAAQLLKYQYYKQREGYQVRNLGVMVVGIDFSEIESRIDTKEMPDRTQIVIMDAQGGVLYANQESENLLPKESLAFMRKNNAGGTADYCEIEGTRYLVQINEVAMGLDMLTIVPVDDMNRMSFEMLSMLLVILVVALVIGMLLISFLSHAITAPIVRLAEQMNQGIVELVEEKNLGSDEIGILYQGYNRMQKRIQEMLRDIWNSAEKQKNAELKLLQAQINPHFVYNSLGTISCHALLNGQHMIAEQLNVLVQIMRYSTVEPDELVPLEKELQIIRQYVKIQTMGSGSHISVICSIEPECEAILIPKLTVQPLVENSVIHGLDSAQRDGKIEIRAGMTGQAKVNIVVADNGNGGDIQRINRYVHGDQELDNVHGSLGVKNVYDRIKRMYGQDGDLEYRVGQDGRMEAVITIWMKGKPLQRSE